MEKSSADDDIRRMLCRQRDQQEKTVSGLKARMAKAAEEHEKVYLKVMKVKQGKLHQASRLAALQSYSSEFE